MKKKLTTVTLIATLVLSGLAASTMAEAASTTSRGEVEFKPASDDTEGKPHDPEKENPEEVDPDDEIDPPVVYPKGPLRLHHVPTLSFGVNEISAKGQKVSALLENIQDITTGEKTARASFVEVADERGTLAGWNVSVQNDGIFTSDKGTIEGTMTFSAPAIRGINGMEASPEMAPTGNGFAIGKDYPGSATVMTAAAGKGYNIWQARYGKSDNAVADKEGVLRNGNITLTVPKGQKVLSHAQYVTTLNWTLAQTP